MRPSNRWVVVVLGLIVAGLPLLGCGESSDSASKGEPAKVEPIEGRKLARLTLSPQAAKRLAIETTPVRRKRVGGSDQGGTQRKVVPYSALIYDEHGDTFTYTSPERLIFVRDRVTVDFIEKDLAVLSKGPPTGTEVVSVGAAELFGTEFEVEH